MKKDCSTCLCREGSCYPSITIFDKDKTCRSYTPDYEGYIADLEESNANLKTEIKEKGRTIHTFQVDIGKLKNENVELKTVKIPQLERRIASIRGAHSVDCRKLNARTEQVERLKKENAELKKQQFSLRNERNTFLAQNEQYEKDLIDFNENLTKAKEIIQELVHEISVFYIATDRIVISPTVKQAEQFLRETENGK